MRLQTVTYRKGICKCIYVKELEINKFKILLFKN